MIDHRCGSYTHNLSSCGIKAWKNFRPERDSNPWPLRYRCSALPTELVRMEFLGPVPDERRLRAQETLYSYSILRLFSRLSFVFLIWRCSEATETGTAWWSTTWRKSSWLRHWGYCVTKTLKTSWVRPSAWEQKFTAASFKLVSVCCLEMYKLLMVLLVKSVARRSQLSVSPFKKLEEVRSQVQIAFVLTWGRGEVRKKWHVN